MKVIDYGKIGQWVQYPCILSHVCEDCSAKFQMTATGGTMLLYDFATLFRERCVQLEGGVIYRLNGWPIGVAYNLTGNCRNLNCKVRHDS